MTNNDKRMRSDWRTSRLLTMLWLIMNGEGTKKNICGMNQCVDRTFYRDLRALQDFGFPTYFDKTLQRYVMDNAGHCLSKFFTSDEIEWITVMCKAIENELPKSLLQAEQNVVQKLLVAIPAKRRQRVTRLSNFIQACMNGMNTTVAEPGAYECGRDNELVAELLKNAEHFEFAKIIEKLENY